MVFAASLVRRGVEMTHTNPPDGQQPEMPKVSTWAGLLVFFTILGFCVLFFAVQYSYGIVVGSLAMIESSHSDAYVAVDTLPSHDNQDSKSPDSEPLLEPEILLMKSTPITTSIRRTIIHLRANYGYLSRFRGMSLFLCLCIAHTLIAQFFTIIPFMANLIGLSIASVLADLILARWELTWIHIVISEPTAQKWWRRAPPLNSWIKIAPAIALSSVARMITKYLPIIIGMSFGALKRMQKPGYEPTPRELNAACAQSLTLILLAVALVILIQLPATVILVRVAASMLPEENETVVPFDRSFGGKVTPAIIGGAGKIGMVEAWKSFDWSSRIRLLKLIGKVVAIMVALWMLLIVVTVAEAHLIIGSKDMRAVMGAVAARLGQH